VVLAVRQQQHVRNFHVVRPGVLYRSAQLSVHGLRRIVNDYHIRTVINLRDGTTPRDRAEEEFCAKEEIRFVRLLPLNWDSETGDAPADDNVRTFLEVMRDRANYPVLVHCFAGIHRTGAYCAVYRMEFEDWSNEQAIAELKANGYDNFEHEADIRGYLTGYRRGKFLLSRFDVPR
jgi:tyrosine-protein phosphatase SIW14